MMAMGFMELIVIVMAGGAISASGLLGMPPGERDAKLLDAAPTDALFYVDWASRSSGKEGGPGVEGLVADPEVKQFIADVREAILTTIENETENGNPQEQLMGQTIPPLAEILINRPGCLYATFDENAKLPLPGDLQPDEVQILQILAKIKATLIINGGDDANKIAENLTKLLNLLPPELRTKDLKRQTFPMPAQGLQLMLHRHNDYFIFGFGDGAIDKAIAGLDGKRKGLSTNERFNAALKQVPAEKQAGVTWVDVKGLLDAAVKSAGLQGAMIRGMATMVGADAIDSFVATSSVVDGQIQTQSYVNTDGSTKGILALAAGRGIKSNDLAHIPADADLATVVSISLPKILEEVRTIVNQADPRSGEQFEMVISQLETELGLKLEDDIFAAFGDVWTLYDSPSNGGVFVTSLVLGVEVKDAAKAKLVHDELMKVIKAALPGDYGHGGRRRRGVFMAEKTFLDHTVHFVNTIGNEDVPVAPAFCLTEKQWIIALHPQAIKGHLRWLASEESKDSLATRFAAMQPLPEGDLLSYSYCDMKELTRYFYSITPFIGQIIASENQSEGVDFTIFSIPSARAVLPYVGDAWSITVRTKKGIYQRSQGGLPIPGGTTLFFNGSGFLMQSLWLFGMGVRRAVPVEAAPIRVNMDIQRDTDIPTTVMVPDVVQFAPLIDPQELPPEPHLVP